MSVIQARQLNFQLDTFEDLYASSTSTNMIKMMDILNQIDAVISSNLSESYVLLPPQILLRFIEKSMLLSETRHLAEQHLSLLCQLTQPSGVCEIKAHILWGQLLADKANDDKFLFAQKTKVLSKAINHLSIAQKMIQQPHHSGKYDFLTYNLSRTIYRILRVHFRSGYLSSFANLAEQIIRALTDSTDSEYDWKGLFNWLFLYCLRDAGRAKDFDDELTKLWATSRKKTFTFQESLFRLRVATISDKKKLSDLQREVEKDKKLSAILTLQALRSGIIDEITVEITINNLLKLLMPNTGESVSSENSWIYDLLSELARICARFGNEKTATKILEFLKRSKNTSPTSILLIELTKVDLLLFTGQKPDVQTGQVSNIFDLEKRQEALNILQKILRVKLTFNPLLIYEACLMVWNASLPLLNENHSKELLKPFIIASKLLEEIESNDCSLRIRFHFELTKIFLSLKSERTGVTDFSSLKNAKTNIIKCRELLHFDENSFDKNKIYVLLEKIKMIEGSSKHSYALTIQTLELKLKSFTTSENSINSKELVYIGNEIKAMINKLISGDRTSEMEDQSISDFQTLLRAFELLSTTVETMVKSSNLNESIELANCIVEMTEFNVDDRTFFNTLCRESQELSIIRVNTMLLRASTKIKLIDQQGHSFAHVLVEPLSEIEDTRNEIAVDFETSAKLAVAINQKWLVFNVGVAFWNAYLPVFRTEDQSKQIHGRILVLLKNLFLNLKQTILIMEKSKIICYDSELSIQIFCNISLVYLKVLEKEGDKGKEMSKEVVDALMQIKIPAKIRKDVNKVLSKGINKASGIGNQSDQFLFEISSKLESAVGMEIGNASKMNILQSVFEQLQNYNGETDKEVLMEMYIKLASISFNEKTIFSIKLCLCSVTFAKAVYNDPPKSVVRLLAVACMLEAKSLHLLVESNWVSETKSEELLLISLESSLNYAIHSSKISNKKSIDIIKRFCIILDFIRLKYWTEKIKPKVVELIFSISGLLLENSENCSEMLSDVESSMMVSNMIQIMREAALTKDHWRFIISTSKSALLYLNNHCKDQVWGIYVLALTNIGEININSFNLFQECGTRLQAELLQIIAMASLDEPVQFKAFEKSLELMKREGSMEVLQIVLNFANWMLTKSFPREKITEFVEQIEEVVLVIDEDQSRVFKQADLILQMCFIKLKLVDKLDEEIRLMNLIFTNSRKIIEIIKDDSFNYSFWFKQEYVIYLELIFFIKDKLDVIAKSFIDVLVELIDIISKKLGGRFVRTELFIQALYLYRSDQLTSYNLLLPSVKSATRELTEAIKNDIQLLSSQRLDSNMYTLFENKINHPPLVFLYILISNCLTDMGMTEESLEISSSLHFICQEKQLIEFLGPIKLNIAKCLFKKETIKDIESLIVQSITTLTQINDWIELQDSLVSILILDGKFKDAANIIVSFQKQLTSENLKSKKLSPLLMKRANLNVLFLKIKLNISKLKKFNETSILEPSSIIRESIKRSTQEIFILLIEYLEKLEQCWNFNMSFKINQLMEEFFIILIESVPAFELDIFEILYVLQNSLFLVHNDFLKNILSFTFIAGIRIPNYVFSAFKESPRESDQQEENNKNINNVLAEQALSTMSKRWTLSNIRKPVDIDKNEELEEKSPNMIFLRFLIISQTLNISIAKEILLIEKKFKRNSICFPMSLEISFFEKFFYRRRVLEEFIAENGLSRKLLGINSNEDEYISRQCVERTLAITNFSFKRIIWIENLLLSIVEENEKKEFIDQSKILSGFFSQLAWENNLLLDFTNNEIRQAFHITEADTELKNQLKEEDMKRLRKIPNIPIFENISIKNYFDQCLRISENKAFFPFDRDDESIQFSSLLLYQQIKSVVTAVKLFKEECFINDQLLLNLNDVWRSTNKESVQNFISSSSIFSNLLNFGLKSFPETSLPPNSMIVSIQVDTIGFEMLLGLSIKGSDVSDVTNTIIEISDSQYILQQLFSFLKVKEKMFLNDQDNNNELEKNNLETPALTRHEYKMLKKSSNQEEIEQPDDNNPETPIVEETKVIFNILENEDLVSQLSSGEGDIYKVLKPVLDHICNFLVGFQTGKIAEFESKIDTKKKGASLSPPLLNIENLFIIVDSSLVRIPFERLILARLAISIQRVFKDLHFDSILKKIKRAEELSLLESVCVTIDNDNTNEYKYLLKLNNLYSTVISKQIFSDCLAFISYSELQNLFYSSKVLFYKGLSSFFHSELNKGFFSVIEASRLSYLCVLDKIILSESSFEIFKKKFPSRSLHREFRVYLTLYVLLDLNFLMISEDNLGVDEIEHIVTSISQEKILSQIQSREKLGSKLLTLGCTDIPIGKQIDKKKSK